MGSFKSIRTSIRTTEYCTQIVQKSDYSLTILLTWSIKAVFMVSSSFAKDKNVLFAYLHLINKADFDLSKNM